MKIGLKVLLICMACWVHTALVAQSAAERQKGYLKDILEINIPQRFKENTRRVTHQDSTWADWLHRTQELPPDFSRMPSVPFLPDPLVQRNGGREQPVKTREEWEEQRAWIKEQYQKWVSGTFPSAPEDVKVRILSEKEEGGTRIQLVELRFGLEEKGVMTVELLIPEGKGPFPVYMTQWNHRGWAQLAVRRGYIGCVYAGADLKDDTEAYQALYPTYDWSMLMRRAWGASRVVDYLLTRPEVNKNQIALTGHSRNGKQSLWAAAFDERIAAVISSSSGTGGTAPWRYGDPQFASETLDYVAALNGHWFHPRLRFFFGREDKLPVDQNSLLSLIAPRPLLFHYSLVEGGYSSWADEQNYHSVKKVYAFLGAEDKIGLHTRMGKHPVAARDIERCLDFLDIQFKGRNLPWEDNSFYDYAFASWAKGRSEDSLAAQNVTPVVLKQKYASASALEVHKKEIRDKVQWLLGKEASGVKTIGVKPIPAASAEWISLLTGRPEVPGAKALSISSYTSMGDYVSGTLYVPEAKDGKMRTQASGKMPVVVYLHQYAYSNGYAWGYNKDGLPGGNSLLFQTLTDKGFAVLAFDMLGFGSRIEEGKYFYERFPEWSKMGKMVTDVKASVDALESLDYIDPKHIYLFGNTIGGSVGMMTAALDARIAGVAVVAAFSPWRTSNSQYESIRSYSHLHGFIPRLGWYAQSPQKVPVDFPEIISCISPRPLMVIAPVLDRHADPQGVSSTLKTAAKVYGLYGKQANLLVQTPREINRLTEPMMKDVADFYAHLLKNQ